MSAPVPHTSSGLVGVQARVEQVAEPGQGRGAQRREGHPDRVGDVDDQRALGARVVHGREPAGRGAAPGGEQLDGVAQLVQVVDAEHVVGVEERLVRAVLAGQRARVRGCTSSRARPGAADLERDDGHVARPRRAASAAAKPSGSRAVSISSATTRVVGWSSA